MSKKFDQQPPADPATGDIAPNPFFPGVEATGQPGTGIQDGSKPAAAKKPRAPKPIMLDLEFSEDDKSTIGLAIMLHHAINRRLGKTTPAEDGKALLEMVRAWYRPAASELAEKGIIS